MEYTDPCDDCTHWLGKLNEKKTKITVYKRFKVCYNNYIMIEERLSCV